MACYVANFGAPDLDDDQEQKNGETNPFGPFSGQWGPFFRNSSTRLAEIVDGTSRTFMIGERQNGPFRTAGSNGSHTEYETTWIAAVRDVDDASDDHGHMVLFQTGHTPNHRDSDDRDVSASHPTGAHFLLCDGSTQNVSEGIDFQVYQAYGTMNVAEVTSSDL